MAIASCSVKIISRGKGRSAVAAAAYRSGQELHSEYDGIFHSYTRKRGILHSEILTPAQAPDWASDRQQLWNQVELMERRKDARLAREVMIALPRELSSDQNIEIARAYAKTFVEQGMIADVSIHDSGDGNPHAHIMLTDRPINKDGFSKKKNTDWNASERVIEWRQEYERITNQYLERCGYEQRIDVRSYAEQGIDQLPTIHLGSYAHRMKQQGVYTERWEINQQIEEDNRKLKEISNEIARLEAERQRLQSKAYSLIEHYESMKKEIRKTVEELGQRLTDTGRAILIQQEKNVEHALEQLQQPTQSHESPHYHTPTSEPEQQRKWGFDELYENPTQSQQPEPEQTKPREGSSHPKRPPPLRRHREHRHLAGERSRQRTQGKRTQVHHTLTKDVGLGKKTKYDTLYENSPTQQGQKPEPHSPDLSGGGERQTGFDTLYEEPPTKQDQKPEPHSHAPPRGIHRNTDFDALYEKPDNGTDDHPRPDRKRDGPEKEK